MARRRRDGEWDVIYVGFLLGHGGDALQMLALANGIKDRGARVKVIVPAGEHSLTFRDRCAAVGVECERSPLIASAMHGPRQDLKQLLRLFRTLDAPLVHFHTGNSCLPRSAMLALELLRLPKAFVTLQSPYETIEPGTARARFWAATARRRLAAVASPSAHGTNFQIRCGIPANLAVTVRNSIDTTRMASGDGRVPRRLLGIDDRTPLIVFTSRIDSQKRPLDAVRIFTAVADDFPSAVLAFVGQGALEDAVSTEAARLGVRDRVRLVGYQTNIPDWLAAASVWVLPTERENFSVAVLEAMAAGCPILSTSCPGNDEILVDGTNSLTFPIGDVHAGTVGLRALLGDAGMREKMSRACQATAQEFAVDSMVESYCSLYRRSPAAATPFLG
jgi:glycosyltransferase involved in cell wall biosynthesis